MLPINCKREILVECRDLEKFKKTKEGRRKKEEKDHDRDKRKRKKGKQGPDHSRP